MPKKSFAYNLEHSPVSLLPVQNAKTKILPEAMAQVKFKSVCFEFDGDQRKPYMMFDGEIEAYTVMRNSGTDFFDKIERVVFSPESRPPATWRYDFNDKQLADIAAAGWFDRGCEVPPEFLTSSFALIADNIQVDYLNPDRKKGEAPILKVGPAENHMYNFDIKDYELTGFIIDNIREPKVELEVMHASEAQKVEKQEAAKQAAEQRKEATVQPVTSLTAQQMKVRKAAMNAMIYAEEVWKEVESYRAAHSSQYRKERDLIRARKAQEEANKPKQEAAPAQTKKNVTASDEAKLNTFLGAFAPAPAPGAKSPAQPVNATEDKPKVATPAKGGWANIQKAVSSNADAIKARNEQARDINKSDDAAQAVQAEIAEETKTEEQAIQAVEKKSEVGGESGGTEAINARNEEARRKERANNAAQDVQAAYAEEKKASEQDKDGNGIDDRVEAGISAAQSAQAEAKVKQAIAEAQAQGGRYDGGSTTLPETAAEADKNKNKQGSEMGS